MLVEVILRCLGWSSSSHGQTGSPWDLMCGRVWDQGGGACMGAQTGGCVQAGMQVRRRSHLVLGWTSLSVHMVAFAWEFIKRNASCAFSCHVARVDDHDG